MFRWKYTENFRNDSRFKDRWHQKNTHSQFENESKILSVAHSLYANIFYFLLMRITFRSLFHSAFLEKLFCLHDKTVDSSIKKTGYDLIQNAIYFSSGTHKIQIPTVECHNYYHSHWAILYFFLENKCFFSENWKWDIFSFSLREIPWKLFHPMNFSDFEFGCE